MPGGRTQLESTPVEDGDPSEINPHTQAHPSTASESERQKKIFFETKSLAEVYAQQGQIHMALEIYRRVLRRNPSDKQIQDRISELQARLSTRRGVRPKEQNE